MEDGLNIYSIVLYVGVAVGIAPKDNVSPTPFIVPTPPAAVEDADTMIVVSVVTMIVRGAGH